MPSTFTWLDYSEQQRRQMLDVIDLFAESDTRDELGIGAVRDAFAEALFPGVSVVQRRARYLLFVPWIYLDLERRSVPAAQAADRARRAETALINVLAEADDNEGTIGIQAREKLKRLPSNVYWQALGRYGIRVFQGQQDAYHRSFDSYHARVRAHRSRARERDDLAEEAAPHNWHHGLPGPPDDFPGTATFRLGRAEALYLQERILSTTHGSLLAFLVDRGRPCERTDFPWEHPQQAELPDGLRVRVHHARLFSLTIHGAALLYNLMLAERSGSGVLGDQYRELLAGWAGQIEVAGHDLSRWDRARFWEEVASGPGRVGPPTRAFVDGWLDMVLAAGGAAGVAEAVMARGLIEARERQLKGALARLGDRRALELWRGASGAGRLNYRWYTVQAIVNDILTGIEPEAADA